MSEPILFGWKALVQREWAAKCEQVERIPMPHATTAALVRQYLLHFCCGETLALFHPDGAAATGASATGAATTAAAATTATEGTMEASLSARRELRLPPRHSTP